MLGLQLCHNEMILLLLHTLQSIYNFLRLFSLIIYTWPNNWSWFSEETLRRSSCLRLMLFSPFFNSKLFSAFSRKEFIVSLPLCLVPFFCFVSSSLFVSAVLLLVSANFSKQRLLVSSAFARASFYDCCSFSWMTLASFFVAIISSMPCSFCVRFGGLMPDAFSSFAIFLVKFFSNVVNLSRTKRWLTRNCGLAILLRKSAICVQACPLLTVDCFYWKGSTVRISRIKKLSCSLVHSIGGLIM